MTTETRPAFTPGPWRKFLDTRLHGNPEAVAWVIEGPNGPLFFGYGVEDPKANADLVAAAPEMYAALRKFERILRESNKVAYDAEAWWNEMASSALAKAEGR